MSSTLGRYELLSRLGRGGMADVYLARRRGMGGIEKRLAIKRIRRERARDPRLLEMFVHEARLSMSMAHRNIVPMFDFGRVGDELFLVMEFIDGADLGEALDRARQEDHPLPPSVAAYVAMEACQALDYASQMVDEEGEARAIIHRDVTPRNVLLSYAGEVKLVDFGVATTETELSQAKKVRGTPSYMAPEQARGDQVDVRADLFSVGLILWESLSGRRARSSTGSLKKLLEAAREARVEPLPENVPEQLAAIVATATARDPVDRYASARAMQLALDEYLVTARAMKPGHPPPSHQLSEWLRELCPPGRADGDASVPGDLVGSVVTFLDDGDIVVSDQVAAPADHPGSVGPDSSGEATVLSMAMTLAEEDEDENENNSTDQPATTDNGSGTDAIETPAARSSRYPSRSLLAVGAAVATAAAIYVIAGGGSASEDAVSHDRATAVVTPAPPPATIPPIGSQVDAAPAPSVEPGTTAVDTAAAPPPSAAISTSGRHKRPRPERKPRVTPTKTAPPDAGVIVTAAPGAVRISSSPWATVRVVGSDVGCAETPCRLKLPAGRYTLKLSNPVARVGKTITVNVVSGATLDVVENLTRGN